jgi:hypothetical protein
MALPRIVLDYFFWRAANNGRISRSISPQQREKTHQEILKNLDRMRGSDLFSAMLADAERFGIEAVTFPDET